MKKVISIFITVFIVSLILSVNALAAPIEIQGAESKDNTESISYDLDYVASLSVSGQEDWYEFTTKDIDGYYEIITKNINIPRYNSYYAGLAVAVYSDYDELLLEYSANENEENMGNVKLERDTTYYVKFYSPNLDKPTGNYRFKLIFHNDSEPDLKEYAKTLPYTKTYSSDLCAYGDNSFDGDAGADVDWFKFTATNKKTLLYTHNKNLDMYNSYYDGLGVAVYTKYDEQLYYKTIRKNEKEVGSLELEVGEEYYIKVFSTSGYKGNYDIKIYVNHAWDNGVVTKKATCKTTGVKTYTCTDCGTTKTEAIAKLTKHTYTNNCDTACNVCKAKRTIKHTYKTTTTKVTLSKNGKIVKKCAVCGKVASTTTIKYVKTIKLSATSYVYNGKAKTPTVTVKDSAGKTLKKGTDYTVSYAKGRKNVGTYKVTIKFKGNYSGTKTLTFKILPKAASINKLTAKSKAILVKLNRVTTQSTGYQIQYSTSSKFTSAKTVTVGSYKTSSKTISGLKKGKKYYVRVRTYKTVGKTKFYSAWSSAKSVKTK